MKKLWVNLLAVLLFAALAMACASAEADEAIILGDGSDLAIQVEATDDGIVLEDDLSMDVPELPVLGENDGIVFDLALEDVEAVTASPDNAIESNDDAGDFEIINGILVKYKGKGGDVVIPYGVTTIGAKAFYDCDSLTGVSIPNSVTTIGDSAFYNCDSLISVSIPNSVTTIGGWAFQDCSNLTSVNIPNSVTSIGDIAFSGCTSLTSISIPNSVTSIGDYMFYDCHSLTSVTIPNSVTIIHSCAFYRCTNLTSVTIPNSVTSIEGNAFDSCTSLTSISIPNSVTSVGRYAFSSCTSLTSVSIGTRLTFIGEGIFNGCRLLKSILFPANISEIHESAFKNCYSLIDVTILNGNLSINDDAFSGCPTAMTFHTPCDSATTKWAEGKGYKVVKSDHTPVTDPAVDPTCSETGLTEGSHCSVCNTIIKAQEVVPALNHTPVTDPAVEPTCTQTGLTEGSHCSVCNAIIKAQEVVPVAEHTPVTDPAVEPTCTQTGLTEGSHCSVCGEVLVEQSTIPKADHTYVIDDAVAPTCKKTGLTAGAHCSVCGKVFVKQKKIPKLISLRKCAVTGIEDAVYTGKAIKPAPVVKYNGKKLVKGTDFTVKYAANKAVGTATVTITGIGKYGESVNKTFKINPKAVALASLTPGAQQLTVKWNKGTGITGYEVQYALKKSFAGAKKVSIAKARTVSTVIKSLAKGKTYYVRVRAYKTVNGKKYYSAWSKAKGAKVK